jgi:hypothetical protein
MVRSGSRPSEAPPVPRNAKYRDHAAGRARSAAGKGALHEARSAVRCRAVGPSLTHALQDRRVVLRCHSFFQARTSNCGNAMGRLRLVTSSGSRCRAAAKAAGARADENATSPRIWAPIRSRCRASAWAWIGPAKSSSGCSRVYDTIVSRRAYTAGYCLPTAPIAMSKPPGVSAVDSSAISVANFSVMLLLVRKLHMTMKSYALGG